MRGYTGSQMKTKEKNSFGGGTTVSHNTRNRAGKLNDGPALRAIKKKCRECTGNQQSEIDGCDIQDCALWAFRPIRNTGAKGQKERMFGGERK